MNNLRATRQNQKGFTIIELMIAVSILSVILLIGSVVLISVGKLYTKGVNSTNLQDATRNVLNDISSTLEFSGEQPFACLPTPTPYTCEAVNSGGSLGELASTHPDGTPMTIYAYCVGTTRYSYVMNTQSAANPSGTQNYHVIWKDTMTSDASCYPLDIKQQNPTFVSGQPSVANSGKELAPLRSRLTRFYVEPQSTDGSQFGVDVWMAYGEDDIVLVTGTGACSAGSGSSNCAGYSSCQGGQGQEYCANSKLSTTITRRLH